MALKDSRIIVDPEVMARLEAWTAQMSCEFSGFGVVEPQGNDFFIPRIYLMAVGSEGYTEIPGEKIIEMRRAERERAKPGQVKLWFHRHPIESWSGTDEATCRQEPLASTPEAVEWALAIVRTPSGWLGRLDTFKIPATYALPVFPDYARSDANMIAEFRKEWLKQHQPAAYQTGYPRRSYVGKYTQQAFDAEGIFGMDDEITDIVDPELQAIYETAAQHYGMYADFDDWFSDWYEYQAKAMSFEDFQRFADHEISTLRNHNTRQTHLWGGY